LHSKLRIDGYLNRGSHEFIPSWGSGLRKAALNVALFLILSAGYGVVGESSVTPGPRGDNFSSDDNGVGSFHTNDATPLAGPEKAFRFAESSVSPGRMHPQPMANA